MKNKKIDRYLDRSEDPEQQALRLLKEHKKAAGKSAPQG